MTTPIRTMADAHQTIVDWTRSNIDGDTGTIRIPQTAAELVGLAFAGVDLLTVVVAAEARHRDVDPHDMLTELATAFDDTDEEDDPEGEGDA